MAAGISDHIWSVRELLKAARFFSVAFLFGKNRHQGKPSIGWGIKWLPNAIPPGASTFGNNFIRAPTNTIPSHERRRYTRQEE
jgi:hypothetical protein